MLKLRLRKLLLVQSALMLVLSLLPLPAFGFNGIPEKQQQLYDQGIRYFDINIAGACWSPANSTPSADRGEFIEKYGQYAIQVQRELGLPYEALIAQAIFEGGVPESSLALQYYNYFGIKYNSGDESKIGASGSVMIHNSDGDVYWATFADPQSGWTGYGKFIMTNSRYTAVYNRAFAIDPIGYIKELLAVGYGGSPHTNAKNNPNDSYVQSMQSIISQVHTYISTNHPEWPTMESVEAEAGNTGASNSTRACGAGNLMSDDFVVYNQCDAEWANNVFGTSTICQGGCGPSALAMAITALGGKKVTPADVVRVANIYNVHVAGAGSSHIGLGNLSNKPEAISAWGSFASEKVNSVTIESFNEYFAKGYAIFGAGSGGSPYSSGGHYILIRGVTSDGKWKIGDSGHSDTSDKDWDPATLIGPMADNSGSVYAIKKGD